MPKPKKRITRADRQRWGRKGGRQGGRLRALALTPERRSEIARKAIAARWAKKRVADEASAAVVPRETEPLPR